MRLKNKKTGEICDFKIIADYDDCTSGWRLEKHNGEVLFYDHIDEIHEEWEDYEEPKMHWMIDTSVLEPVREIAGMPYEIDKEIGNWFSTKEEAELALSKLKAWQRLKDKGFRFDGWTIDDGLRISVCTNLDSDGIYDEDRKEVKKDLDICFGGEE